MCTVFVATKFLQFMSADALSTQLTHFARKDKESSVKESAFHSNKDSSNITGLARFMCLEDKGSELRLRLERAHSRYMSLVNAASALKLQEEILSDKSISLGNMQNSALGSSENGDRERQIALLKAVGTKTPPNSVQEIVRLAL